MGWNTIHLVILTSSSFREILTFVRSLLPDIATLMANDVHVLEWSKHDLINFEKCLVCGVRQKFFRQVKLENYVTELNETF